MRFSSSVPLFATLAMAASVDVTKREAPLNVELEMVGNSNVKASVTNTGTSAIKVFKTGSILDKSAVEKTKIFAGPDKVAFDGIRLRVSTESLDESAFQIIDAGETVTATWDVAEVHDMSAGGAFLISSTGMLQYAAPDSTEISGALPFSSNVLTATVDGHAAASVRRSFLGRRQVVQSDCTGTKRSASISALAACASLAARAQTAAASGDAAKMTEYFKSSSSSTRSTVAGVFGKIATECGSSTAGVSKEYCTDVYSSCSSGVLAYTLPSQSYMVNCPLYFSALSPLSSKCHAQDQATTTLHETTHLRQIKGTTDQNGCYGYSCVKSLTAAQNLNHADTYALFANALYAGC